MIKMLWTPTYDTASSIGIQRGITPVDVEVEVIGGAKVVIAGVLRDNYATIRYNKENYIVPNSTLSRIQEKETA